MHHWRYLLLRSPLHLFVFACVLSLTFGCICLCVTSSYPSERQNLLNHHICRGHWRSPPGCKSMSGCCGQTQGALLSIKKRGKGSRRKPVSWRRKWIGRSASTASKHSSPYSRRTSTSYLYQRCLTRFLLRNWAQFVGCRWLVPSFPRQALHAWSLRGSRPMAIKKQIAQNDDWWHWREDSRHIQTRPCQQHRWELAARFGLLSNKSKKETRITWSLFTIWVSWSFQYQRCGKRGVLGGDVWIASLDKIFVVTYTKNGTTPSKDGFGLPTVPPRQLSPCSLTDFATINFRTVSTPYPSRGDPSLSQSQNVSCSLIYSCLSSWPFWPFSSRSRCLFCGPWGAWAPRKPSYLQGSKFGWTRSSWSVKSRGKTIGPQRCLYSRPSAFTCS